MELTRTRSANWATIVSLLLSLAADCTVCKACIIIFTDAFLERDLEGNYSGNGVHPDTPDAGSLKEKDSGLNRPEKGGVQPEAVTTSSQPVA